jgi:hypothetical protein
MNSRILKSILFLTALVFASNVFAQPGGPGGPSCWPPPCTVPVNSGVIILIAGGVAYGIYSLLTVRNKKTS